MLPCDGVNGSTPAPLPSATSPDRRSGPAGGPPGIVSPLSDRAERCIASPTGEKLAVRLVPRSAMIGEYLSRNGHNPRLQYVLRRACAQPLLTPRTRLCVKVTKSVSAVLDHMARKWLPSSDMSAIVPPIRLYLSATHPRAAEFRGGFGAENCQGRDLRYIHNLLGRPAELELEYAWPMDSAGAARPTPMAASGSASSSAPAPAPTPTRTVAIASAAPRTAPAASTGTVPRAAGTGGPVAVSSSAPSTPSPVDAWAARAGLRGPTVKPGPAAPSRPQTMPSEPPVVLALAAMEPLRSAPYRAQPVAPTLVTYAEVSNDGFSTQHYLRGASAATTTAGTAIGGAGPPALSHTVNFIGGLGGMYRVSAATAAAPAAPAGALPSTANGFAADVRARTAERPASSARCAHSPTLTPTSTAELAGLPADTGDDG